MLNKKQDKNLTPSMKIKFFFIIYISFCAPQLLASKLQTTASIDKAVRHFIASSLPSETEYKVTLSQFDSRLKIPFCKQALDIFIRNMSIKAGRNSIGIKCNAKKNGRCITLSILVFLKMWCHYYNLSDEVKFLMKVCCSL